MSATLHRTEGSPNDAVDAARWRRLVNASELPFPVAAIADDPENDRLMVYGRKRMEQFIDSLDLVSDKFPPAPSGWISIDERLPELGASVALLKENGWENTGGDLEMNIRACGYLADGGPFRYWSIRGERATELKYFTHWMPLPPAPNQGEAS